MAGISRGLDFLRRQQEQAAQKANKTNRMWKFWIRSGDTARFYFLGTDPDNDMLAPLIHSVERTKKDGTKWEQDVLCARETYDDPREMCEYCVEGAKGPYHRLISYVWGDSILHQQADKEGKWELMKRGNTKVFVETPEPRVRLYIMKSRMAQQVMKKFEENGTLYDRPFKLEKSGAGTSTLEVLSCGDDPAPIPQEVLDAFQNLPPLEDTIRAEFGGYQKSTFSASGNGIYTPPTNEELAEDDNAIDFE